VEEVASSSTIPLVNAQQFDAAAYDGGVVNPQAPSTGVWDSGGPLFQGIPLAVDNNHDVASLHQAPPSPMPVFDPPASASVACGAPA